MFWKMLSFASHPAFQKWSFGFKRPCGILGVKPCATNSQFSQHGKASVNPCVQRCVHPCALPSDLIPGVPVASVRPARFFHDRDSECYARRFRAELSWRMGKREEELEIACAGDGVMAQIGSSYSTCASIQRRRLRTLFCQGRQGRWHRLPYGEVSFLD